MAYKTGIITFQNANNYGAVLQAFALQTTLEELGHNVSVINYDSPLMELKSCQGNNFKSFINQYLNLTEEYNCSREIKADDYDLLIAGSDQVWNPAITAFDTAYFLNFKKEYTKGASYAASIGIHGDDLYKCKDFFAENIQRIERISIRERQQSSFIESVSGKTINVNIDPTLLMDAEQYKRIFDIEVNKDNYIFMYTNNTDAKLLDFVNLLSLYTGYPVISVSKYEEMLFTDGSKVFNRVNPVEWMQAIASSSIVITDSFHGLMFSMIFEKPFYVYTKNRYNVSRITDILETCGLTDRKLGRIASVRDVVYDVDFSETKEFIINGKEEAIEYLNSVAYSDKRFMK